MKSVAVKIEDEVPGHIRSAVSARAAIGGAAVKTAGGTEELHSRSGRVVFTLPCRLATLSGRSAAQDGQGTMPGGPERAEVKGSGGTLSAGRAAAPGSRVGAEWRSRSDDRVARASAERAKPGGSCGHGAAARASARARPFQAMARAVFVAIAAVCLFVGPAAATDKFVKPGDEGTIEFPLENDSSSGQDATGVQLTLRVEPASMADRIQFNGTTVKEDSNAALPITIAVGQTRTLVVSYTILNPEGAGDGSFQVFLDASIPDQIVSPDPSTWDTSIRFYIDSTAPFVNINDGSDDLSLSTGATRSHSVTLNADDGANGVGIATVTLSGYDDTSFDGERYVELPFEDLDEGDYSGEVVDKVGNRTPFHFTVDRTNPVVVLTNNEGILVPCGSETDSMVVFSTSTDEGGLERVSLLDGDNAARGDPVALPYLTKVVVLPFANLTDSPRDPNKPYTVSVHDRAGNSKNCSFMVRHAPFVSLSFTPNNHGFEYLFEYYGVSEQSFSIPYATVTITIQDISGISGLELFKDGVSIFAPSYGTATSANEERILADGQYEFVVTTARGQTTSGTFTKYTERVTPDLSHPIATVHSADDTLKLKFPISCFNNGGPGTGLSEVTVRHVSMVEDEHEYGPALATVACGGDFDKHLDDGLYAVTGVDHGYEIDSFFKIEQAPAFLSDYSDRGYAMENPVQLDVQTRNDGPSGLVIRSLPESENYPASGKADTLPIDLFQPTTHFFVPVGAVGVSIAESPADGLKVFYEREVTEPADVPGDTGLSLDFAIASDAESFQSIGKWKRNNDGENVLTGDLSEGPPRLLTSPVRIRETLTSNAVNYLGRPPHTITPFANFSPIKLSYFTAAAAPEIEDLPFDTFAGLPDISGIYEFAFRAPHGFTVGLGDPNDPTIRGLVAERAAQGYASAGGHVVVVDPPILVLNQPGEAKMRFSSNTVLALGMEPAALALYQAEPGGYFERVASQSLDLENGVITGLVTRLSDKSLFAIFGPAAIIDLKPPRTVLTGIPSYAAPGSTFTVSTQSFLSFSVVDDKIVVGDGLGVGSTRTYYAIDGGAFAAAPSTFSLVAAGTHTVVFYSVDLHGNAEAPKTRLVAVDATAPLTLLSRNGAVVTLSTTDPLISGVNSGVARIRYLVDIANPAFCESILADTGAAPGMCANPWYAGPFTLSPGGHEIAFQAVDGVGNFETLQTQHVDVQGSGPAAGGKGIGRDPFDSFWSVISDGSVSFARADSSGTFLSSATLENALSGLPWAVFFDTAGRAYAVGTAAGPGTQAADVAVYKAAPEGGAIVSRTLFDSGYANNDYVFDALAPGWITGTAQTSGGQNGGEFTLALWAFDPATGAVALSTTYARAGTDVGTGLAVDADGSLWIAGYSRRPGASQPGALDLAVWHYAADGRTLLAGPFLKPGYLTNPGGGTTAKLHVTETSVYVAAPRINASGGTDLAFLKFDKATGAAGVENIWRSADGDPSYPTAILPEASGVLIAGGIGSDMTDAALWRFGYDGVFQGATTADAGGAKGAVFKGTQLWLSVEGSTTPYRVLSETAAPGALIDISTPATGAALSPSSGPIGVPFTIAGTGFGTYGGGDTRVKFGTLAAPLSLWNDAAIAGTVPGLSSGTYAVTIERQNASSVTVTAAGSFMVTIPSATSLSPASGPIGVPFTIAGAGFGPYGGSGTRVKFGASAAALSVWNDATISGTVPALATGTWNVVVEREQDGMVSSSSASSFTVTALSVASISPSSGPIGTAFTLTGPGFGPYAGGNSLVLIDGATAALSVWNDATIVGTVPGSLAVGAHAALVRRTEGAGVSDSNAVAFLVTGTSVGALSPSFGPIGAPFTLTGTQFGAYDGANTRVKFGAVVAALSVWNDTTISGTVPPLSTGTYGVVVERQQGSDVSSSSSSAFTVTALSVASISPSSGPIGTAFTLTGPGFGPYAGGNSVVLVDGTTAALSVWNDATIVGTIPGGAPGVRAVVVRRISGAGVSDAAAVNFQVTGMTLDGLSPASGPIGAAFTLTGSQFGTYGGANTRVKFGGVAAALSAWSDTSISGTVPSLATGTVTVVVERQQGADVATSNASSFTVASLSPTGISPNSGPIGAPFTVSGHGFGAYAGANTRALMGGVVVSLSVWNDTTITGTVPGSLAPGTYPAWLERSSGDGVQSSATGYFTVVVPVISSITPGFGPPETVVTLSGSGFGPYGGGQTKVLIGGTTVPLSVWNDSTIVWTVPASFADGNYPVVVERVPSDGTVDSASATFTVGTGYGGASFGFAAPQSLAARPDSHFQGDLALSSTTGGRIDTPAKAAVDIPPNAMDGDTEITLKRLRSDGLRARAADEIKKRAAGEPIEFGPEGARFNTPVTIELPYEPALIADESKVAIHYFNPLRRAWEELPSEVDRARHVVKAKTDHFSIYQPMGLAPTSAAQDEFYFRDQYAFPNPMRGGGNVTFRILPGLAQTVEVRVYDVSGRKIHDSSDFTHTIPGGDHVYDHVWNVSGAGSGVYTYVIKASQAGQKPISRSGKVGVIK